jgi:hypothetical protein
MMRYIPNYTAYLTIFASVVCGVVYVAQHPLKACSCQQQRSTSNDEAWNTLQDMAIQTAISNANTPIDPD